MIDWRAPLAAPIEREIREAIRNLPGWPNIQREKQLAQLVLDRTPALIVEIGVWGGRSLIPQALALQYNATVSKTRSGHIYGIDPYDACEVKKNAVQGDDWFPGQNTMDEAYGNLLATLKLYELEEYASLIKEKSETVLNKLVNNFTLENIDILNIDGGHTEEASTRDVEVWVPRVKPGGWIWFDDSHWPSVQRALKTLGNTCTLESDQGLYRLYRKKD